MSQLLGVEKDRERQSDRGQELNSSPSLPLTPPSHASSKTQIKYTIPLVVQGLQCNFVMLILSIKSTYAVNTAMLIFNCLEQSKLKNKKSLSGQLSHSNLIICTTERE